MVSNLQFDNTPEILLRLASATTTILSSGNRESRRDQLSRLISISDITVCGLRRTFC